VNRKSGSARALVTALVVTALVGLVAWVSRSEPHLQSSHRTNQKVRVVPTLGVSGSLLCSITGTATFAPALQHANEVGSSGPTAFTLVGTLTNCNNKSLSAGAAPVKGGTVAMTGTVDAGSSCADLISGPEDITFDPSTFTVKLVRQRAGAAATTTTLKTDVSDVQLTDPTGYDLTGWTYDSDPLTSNAFKNETVSIALRVDNYLDLGGCVAGRTDLPKVSFSAGGYSALRINP
jgi:hypothetical protein